MKVSLGKTNYQLNVREFPYDIRERAFTDSRQVKAMLSL
jgi:hypothetical protein